MTPSTARPGPLELPDGIAALGPEAREAVAAMVTAAERRQAREVEAALHEGLRVLPRPLRGIARKVLVG
jgi:hypothetical protein